MIAEELIQEYQEIESHKVIDIERLVEIRAMLRDLGWGLVTNADNGLRQWVYIANAE